MIYKSYTSHTHYSRRLKPIITLYSQGQPALTKKFEGYIEAAFWIGLEYSDGDVISVKARQPSESYDTDVADLLEFSALMVRRQINFSIEFFEEPPPKENHEQSPPEEPSAGPGTPSSEPVKTIDYKTELNKLKEDYDKKLYSRRQYEAKRDALLKKWKEGVEGGLSR
jgi:hypothetical protein